jgi:hypothetical protein
MLAGPLPSFRLALGIAALVCTAACGGGGGDIPEPPPGPVFVTVTVTPSSAQPFLGQTQQFTAEVTGTTNTAVTWSVNGVTGGGPGTGTISTSGLYTAPQSLPSPASVTLTATSQADPVKFGAATVTVRSDLAVSVAPTAAPAELGATLPAFTVSVSGTGSFSSNVTWSVNGVAGGSATFGTITPSGVYTAPRILPSPASATITATSVADSSRSASATVTITSNFTFEVTGPATLINGASAQFTGAVTPVAGSNPDAGTNWSVSGSGCVGVACGLIDSTGRYTAPNTPPNPPTVRITGVSMADASKTDFQDVTITSDIAVFVSPTSATVAPGATQQFLANVAGDNSNAGVSWSVSGAGCSGTACGTIDANGLYAAPNLSPAPPTVTVTATSIADASKTASATVTIATFGPNVSRLLPASITAGPATGFTFKVIGAGFTAGPPGSGSTILFRGSSRTTTCAFTTECTFFLPATDVPVAENIPVQVRNPDGTLSNQAVFMAVTQATTTDVISLTSAAPAVTGKDIVVVEPTTAGSGAGQINIRQIALFVNNSCSIRSASVSVARPASGTSDIEICLVGDGLSGSQTFSISGPTPNDITIVGVVDSGLVLRLQLRLSSTTQLGPRTIFVENANREKTAAPGALEVKAP